MPLEVGAIYEDGCLKLDRPLPLDERQRVRIVVEAQLTAARRNYGIIGWKGDAQTVRRVALEPGAGMLESP